MRPTDINTLDLSAYLGLTAVGAVTLNMLLGMLMAFHYSPLRNWPHRRFNYFRLHNWCGYIALSASILHPAILLLNKRPKFVLMDLVYPVHSLIQPLVNTIGAIALQMVAIVVITSCFRTRLGRPIWKAFHFSIYVAAAALFFHGLLAVPDLKNEPVDWLDGGKIFVELSLTLIVIVGLLRWRYARRNAGHAGRIYRPAPNSYEKSSLANRECGKKDWTVG
jgi:methionine sulfoxide reductase heme-binding subunit